MTRKRKMPAARNPFVALALKRKAGSHRKTAKAMRRAEKVSLQGDVARRSSSRLLTDWQGFDSLRPHQSIVESGDGFRQCLPRWRNGSRAGLRNQCLRACRFKPDLGHQ